MKMKAIITFFVIMTFLFVTIGCVTQKGPSATTNTNTIQIEDAGDNPDSGSMNTVPASTEDILPGGATGGGSTGATGNAIIDIPDLIGDNPDAGSSDSLDVSTDQIV
jgi:hypothetical protein